MQRKIVYWGATGLVTIVALYGGITYLASTPEAVENFRHVGNLGPNGLSSGSSTRVSRSKYPRS